MFFSNKKSSIKRHRDKFYTYSIPNTNECVFSGIEFAEFIRLFQHPINNILLLENGLFKGDASRKPFLIFEGSESIASLAEEDIYSFGDFAFADFEHVGAANSISENDVAELLYLSHLFKPLNSPFFSALNNRFAYLGHDDGWFCKLYYRNADDYYEMIISKIVSEISFRTKTSNVQVDGLSESIRITAKSGLFIDFSSLLTVNNRLELEVYSIGEVASIDNLLNNTGEFISSANLIGHIVFDKSHWHWE